MRPIGPLENEEQAQVFADYLLLRDIVAQVESNGKGGWLLWVVDEDKVAESAALLSRFRSMPDAEEFHQAPAAAADHRRTTAKEQRQAATNVHRSDLSGVMRGGGLTMLLLIVCVAVSLATQMGQNAAWAGWLKISLAQVSEGQIWRLFTPVFLHFSLWHLLFNLLWLRDLGSVLEGKLGTMAFAFVVALVAVASNLAQFAVGGSGFGGMSGVIYGLFGYIWIRGKREFDFGVVLSPMTSGMLMVFLAMGMFGLLGATANAAHFVGLIAGGALGGLDSWRRRVKP